MTTDLAYFTLFERLSPLLANGQSKVGILLGHEIVTRWVWPGDTAPLALLLANNLESIRKRFSRAGLVIETPDHVSHFVRLV